MRVGEYPAAAGTWLTETQTEAAASGMRAEDSLLMEADVLRRLGIGDAAIADAASRANHSGATLETELLAGGTVGEDRYYRALAALLGLPYEPEIDADSVPDIGFLDSQLIQPRMLLLRPARKAARTVIVPEARRIPVVFDMLMKNPGLRRNMAVSPPSAMRAAVWQAGQARRVSGSVNRLFDLQPGFSARVVLWGRQGFIAGLTVAAVTTGLLLAPGAILPFLHLGLTSLYFLAFLLRCCPLIPGLKYPWRRPPPQPDGPLPVYTVMVPLYREAGVAGQLMTALSRLDWPVSRLDIKLICEADDPETIAALKAHNPGPHMEIVEVPPMQPRTKPKALNYALAGARGDYIAIYDAEDRPHPKQLREAFATFRQSGPDIACLQAPLIITNGQRSWLSALFSLEYSALFRALLPMLARFRMPLPLGGTSNHFRADVLKAAGAWDPFNVTEDADLGMRLYRLGYRSGVLRRQTLEDAPTSMRVWMNQRTRWFKGWLQTWLVLMRTPVSLCRDMGLPAFLVFNLLIAGMLLSSLAHPFILLFIVMALVRIFQTASDGTALITHVLFAMDCVNVLGSYVAVLCVGRIVMVAHEKTLIGWRWATLPLYWMMVSFAAWRAVLELASNPFLWRKTPHEPVASKKQSREETG